MSRARSLLGRAVVQGETITARVRARWLQALHPGLAIDPTARVAEGLRVVIKRGGTITIGAGCVVERNCTLTAKGGTLVIDEGTFVGEGTTMVTNSAITIGRDCLIAAGVTVRDQQHVTGSLDLAIKHQGVETSPISIGADVWLGTRVTVLMGVTIGARAVIGAHSLVNRSIDDAMVAVGSPARPVRRRGATEVESEIDASARAAAPPGGDS